MIPEHTDPSFRVVQGTAEIRADANLVRSFVSQRGSNSSTVYGSIDRCDRRVDP